ncbi:unnamed protein product [Trichogramma brassicae]|uniref:Ig-like domain-containing protein n=1 Tax=Trichogramma brassicae TaxID=86971 RepID=A0A6H5IYY3_9HYME|nr:unnamed protein product [Trichogramma brassicae]
MRLCCSPGIYIIILSFCVECLKNVKLEVSPQAVEQGHEATLRCHYELEEAPLYSLKYYRGSYEFYRYSPNERPQTKIFNFTWIEVDINDAYVRPLTFDTKREKSRKKHSSSVTSSSSRSSTSDEPHQQQLQPRHTSDRQGIQLIMQLQTFHYVSGQLNLRCVVRIADVYEQWSELQLGSNLREPIPERGAIICTQNHFSLIGTVITLREGPMDDLFVPKTPGFKRFSCHYRDQ